MNPKLCKKYISGTQTKSSNCTILFKDFLDAEYKIPTALSELPLGYLEEGRMKSRTDLIQAYLEGGRTNKN